MRIPCTSLRQLTARRHNDSNSRGRVDTSTQSCKVRVTDAETGEMVRFGQAKHPNGTSIDPKFWWDAFLEAAQQAGGLDDVEALAVGGQQHGMVILDQQGNVIRDAMLWNDISSAPQAAALIEKMGEAPAEEGEPEDVIARTSEHRSMYSYVRLSIDRCTATYV